MYNFLCINTPYSTAASLRNVCAFCVCVLIGFMVNQFVDFIWFFFLFCFGFLLSGRFYFVDKWDIPKCTGLRANWYDRNQFEIHVYCICWWSPCPMPMNVCNNFNLIENFGSANVNEAQARARTHSSKCIMRKINKCSIILCYMVLNDKTRVGAVYYHV